MKKDTFSIAGAILAGGKSERMNKKNKAFLMTNGVTFIQNTINILDPIFDEIMIIAGSKEEYSAYGKRCILIEDKIKGIGPLAGLYTGLCATGKKAVFFTACDMPFLHNVMVQLEVSYFNSTVHDAVIPRIGNHIEPLHSIYKTELKDKLRHYINTCSDRSIRNFLKTIKTCYFDIEDNPVNRRAFKNINTINDLKEAGAQDSAETEEVII